MDHIAITNLLYRVAEHLDRQEIGAAAALFEHAQVQLQPNTDFINAEQLLQAWQPKEQNTNDAVITQHLISNPIVEMDTSQHRAFARSMYQVFHKQDRLPLKLVAAGRYHDEFEFKQGQWRFVSRRCLPEVGEMAAQPTAQLQPATASPQNSATRERILTAAQQVFSNVGYSDAGIRRIADAVGLSPTILFRHFGTKAGLFEAALIAAMGEPREPKDRSTFGQHVADMLADPMQINCPHAMSLLATGNEEARNITIRILKEHSILPMIKWLGEPHAESRAKQIMALCAGFALYNTQLNISEPKTIDQHMVNWLAESIQAIVDGT